MLDDRRRVTNKILNILFKSSGKLDSFTLFGRCKVSFSEFSASLRSLIDSGALLEDDHFIHLTKAGRIEFFTENEGVKNFV